MTNPVTPEHGERFQQFIDQWQEHLNLRDWRIHRGEKPAKGAMADMSIDVASHLAVWRIGKHFGTEPVNDYTLESTAVHELLHVLLSDFLHVIESKSADDVIEAAEHRIINTLERLLVRKT